MNYPAFKKNLNAIVVSKKIDTINKSEEADLNMFMTYRWLSMCQDTICDTAKIQVIDCKISAQQETKLLMFNTPKLNKFNPHYIKKQK